MAGTLAWGVVNFTGSDRGQIRAGGIPNLLEGYMLSRTAVWSVRAVVKVPWGAPGGPSLQGAESDGIHFWHSSTFHSAKRQQQIKLHDWLGRDQKWIRNFVLLIRSYL